MHSGPAPGRLLEDNSLDGRLVPKTCFTVYTGGLPLGPRLSHFETMRSGPAPGRLLEHLFCRPGPSKENSLVGRIAPEPCLTDC